MNLIKDQRKFKGSISFIITGDEEGVAINGTKKVVNYLKKKKEKIDFCIVGEPTNPDKVLGEMMKIGTKRKYDSTSQPYQEFKAMLLTLKRANNPSTAL